eukprot:s3118_g15.t1
MESEAVQRYFMTVAEFLQYDSLVNDGRAARLWPSILSKCFESLHGENLAMMLVKVIMRGCRNQMSEALVIREGTAFSGCKHLLELSQIYTSIFGRAVAQICQSEWGSVSV